MAQEGRNLLKAKFETGDRPSQQDFIDLIDSIYNLTDDDADDLADSATKVLMLLTERNKLTGIEPGAEVNPTAGEIKTEYESNANTNAFTDDEQTKLGNIANVFREWVGVVNFSEPGGSVSEISSTFGASITLSNTGVGVYALQSTSEFATNKTFVSITPNVAAFVSVTVDDANTISVTTADTAGNDTDGHVTAALVKITVHP